MTTDSRTLDPLDRLAAQAARLLGAQAAFVSIPGGDHVTFKGRDGGCGAPAVSREGSLSDHALALGAGGMLVVEDARADPRFAHSPLVTGEVALRFYAGAVIALASGQPVGVLCVADQTPRPAPSEAQIEALRALAEAAGAMLDQHEALRAMRDKLDTLRLAESVSGVGHWRLDIPTNRMRWSDQLFRLHRLEPDAFQPDLGRDIRYFHPEDQPALTAQVQAAIRTGEPYSLRLRMILDDGAERLAEVRGVPQRDERGEVVSLFGVLHDITDQQAALEAARRNLDDRQALEAQLRDALAKSQKTEHRYRLLAENMGDVITRVKTDGTSKYISSAIQELLGWRYEEMSGQSLDYVHPEDRGIVLEAIQGVIRDGKARTLQHRAVHRDGRSLWLESHFRAMSDEHRALGEAVVVMRDISDRKALEADLMAARDRAEAGARAKSEFLANMSHELRTPLTSVVGFAGLLKQSAGITEEDRRHVDRIAAGSEALLAVINDILDYSKLEAGGVELEAQPFDPRDLARGAAELMEAQCEAKGLTLDLDLGGCAPDLLVGDAARLRQVLLNFLSNAVKFTAQGGVRVAVSAAPAEEGRARVEVSVADTGIGVSAEAVEQLFERFTQADASTTRNFGGTGLGLAISRQLIEKMGGQIGAHGAPGQGSTFWFRVALPLAQESTPRAAVAGAAPMRTARVLVADDAPANRELVSALLGHMGLEVATVENGAAAVEAMARGGFDLVLMDVQMPVMDGLAATRAIRAREDDGSRTPIIALTANVGLDQAKACLEAGMNGHLAKPINVARLAETLSYWLAPADISAESPHQAA